MKVLLHICCAPCAIYPIDLLRDDGITLMGYFYRNNIHPLTECRRREETLKTYAASSHVKLIIQPGYDIQEFIRNIAFREADRCTICYHLRLTSTAQVARKGKFDSFGTTLLYSKFQNHEKIRATGEAVAKAVGIPFLYRDFRIGWKEGVTRSKEMKMYRQPYCGCIYSETERYLKKAGKTENVIHDLWPPR